MEGAGPDRWAWGVRGCTTFGIRQWRNTKGGVQGAVAAWQKVNGQNRRSRKLIFEALKEVVLLTSPGFLLLAMEPHPLRVRDLAMWNCLQFPEQVIFFPTFFYVLTQLLCMKCSRNQPSPLPTHSWNSTQCSRSPFAWRVPAPGSIWGKVHLASEAFPTAHPPRGTGYFLLHAPTRDFHHITSNASHISFVSTSVFS